MVEPLVRVDTETDRAATLRIFGEVDMANAASLGAALRQHIVPGRLLQLDLSNVDFLGSSAISVLVDLRTLARAADADVVICASSPIVERVLTIAGLAEVFRLGESA